MSYKLCPECDQPILKKGQVRKNDFEYRHANGCPLDDWREENRLHEISEEMARLANGKEYELRLLVLADEIDKMADAWQSSMESEVVAKGKRFRKKPCTCIGTCHKWNGERIGDDWYCGREGVGP